MIIESCRFFLTSTNNSGPTLELAVMNKFNGKTREDLIKLVVLQQSTIDMQGKKITDLESYIDGLVSSVIEVAPVLLHKEVKTSNRQDKSYIYHLLINYYIDIFLDPFSRTRDPNLDRRKFLFPLYVILKKKSRSHELSFN